MTTRRRGAREGRACETRGMREESRIAGDRHKDNEPADSASSPAHLDLSPTVWN